MGRSRGSILKSSKDMNKIKRSLLDRKQELEVQLADIHDEKNPDPTGQDLGDQAMTSIMENLRNSLQDTELNEYNRIVTALQMIEEGSYGVCIDCHRSISEKRLLSYPNATRCVACQEEYEEGTMA